MVGIMRRVFRVIVGWIYWHIFCLKNQITYRSVVLVLTGENHLLDRYSIEYLDLFAKRKSADNALVVWSDKESLEGSDLTRLKLKRIKAVYLSDRKVKLLYDYYSFDKFFDNIVFTYTSMPEENLLGRILAETEVNEKDAVCLALYHLRYVPE